MPKYSFQRQAPLSPEEVRAMIEGSDSVVFKALLAFLYLYGCRIGEALKVKKSDFKLLKQRLRVEIEVEKKRNTGPILFKHPLEVKELPTNVFFLEKIMAHIVTLPQDARVFKMNRKTAWRKIHRLNPQCSAHIFRHTRLRRLADRGADALVLMDVAGWADTRPAGNYLGLSGNLARRFSGKID